MQVSEEQEVFAKEAIFFSEGFFDFDHHLSGPSFCSSRNDGCPLLRVIFIRKARTKSSICFHQNVMAFLDQALYACRCQTDPIFVVFNFFRNSNEHSCLLAQI